MMTLLTKTFGQDSNIEYTQLLLPILVLGIAVVGGLFAAQQPLLAITAAMMVLLVLAIVIWPDTATLAVIFVFYSNAAVIAVKFHGVPFIVGASYTLLLMIPLAKYIIFKRQEIVLNPTLAPLLAFLAVQLLGTLFARDIPHAFSTLMNFVLEGLLIYVLLINAIRTPDILRQATWALLAAGIIMSGIPLFQQITGTFDNTYGGFAQLSTTGFNVGAETLQGADRQFRLSGPIGEKNRYAQIMLMLVPIGLFRFWGERSTVLRLIALAATGLIMSGMILAFSRSAAVAFVLMIGIIISMRLITPAQLRVILIGSLLMMLAFPQYGYRLLSIQTLMGFFTDTANEEDEPDGAFKGRATEMLAAALVFADYPIVGVGPGMVRYYTSEYGNQLGIKILKGNREAHSLYFEIAANHGTLGILSFGAIVYVTMLGLHRVRRRCLEEDEPDLANLVTPFTLSIIVYLTTGMFLHMSFARYFWFILAMGGSAIYVTERYFAERSSQTSTAIVPISPTGSAILPTTREV